MILERMTTGIGHQATNRDSWFWQFFIALPRLAPVCNPKTGDSVTLTGKYVPHFKPGKYLR